MYKYAEPDEKEQKKKNNHSKNLTQIVECRSEEKLRDI